MIMQQEPHTHGPIPAVVVPTHPRSAWVFFGFAGLLAIDMVLAGVFNPDNKKVEFWVMLAVIFGGLLVWMTWIGRRLRRGVGVIAAYACLGSMSGLVLIGAMVQLAGGYPETTPFRGMKVLSVARLVSGLYVVLAWAILVWESLSQGEHAGRKKGSEQR